MEPVIEALVSYLTPVTILVAMFVPSLWVAGAVGVAVAMIGVVVFTTGEPKSTIVAGRMISQVAVALVTNLMRRKAL